MVERSHYTPKLPEEALTMDCQDYPALHAERARGQHLRLDDRGAIQRLHKLGYSNRAIAREVNCSPTTIGNELRRGTPEYSNGRRGRKPGYTARRGQATYDVNRRCCHKSHRIVSDANASFENFSFAAFFASAKNLAGAFAHKIMNEKIT